MSVPRRPRHGGRHRATAHLGLGHGRDRAEGAGGRDWPDPDVERVMRVLAPLGCYRGRVDGVAGDLFRRAVIGYQRSQLFPVGGLHPDGSWATRTQAHYDWVQQLQRTLNAWAGDDIAVDGDYRTVTGDR
ncbi:MAG: hypothetical protein JJE50_05095 [Actinomycetales bacterium]|nr:hypothetical protein [Actinomycetales bacterium]